MNCEESHFKRKRNPSQVVFFRPAFGPVGRPTDTFRVFVDVDGPVVKRAIDEWFDSAKNTVMCNPEICRWIVILIIFTSQAAAAESYTSASTSKDYRIDRSYEVGVPRENYVGEQMVRVRDYFIDTSESGSSDMRLTGTEDFHIWFKTYKLADIRAGDSIAVTGTTDRNGQTYRLVLFPGSGVPALRFLVDGQGVIDASRPLNANGKPVRYEYTVEPDSVRLMIAPSVKNVDTRRGALNFELIYSGGTKGSFQLLYREYTDQDMARPAFSQTVVYDNISGTIRFRQMQINVEEASNEKIRYTIVSDGMPDSASNHVSE